MGWVEFRLLGPLEVVDEGRRLTLGGKQRALLLKREYRVRSLERYLRSLGVAATMTCRGVLHLLASALVFVALVGAIGAQAWAAGSAKPVRVVEVVKPRGFDLRSAAIGAGITTATLGALAAGFTLTTRRRA
jgi:hypothetical protein